MFSNRVLRAAATERWLQEISQHGRIIKLRHRPNTPLPLSAQRRCLASHESCIARRGASLQVGERRYLSTRNISSQTSTANSKNLDHHSAELARMMVPSDANIAGNVHGGTIMKMMEEAAGVAANRYFNVGSGTAANNSQATSATRTRVCALTSRVERMTFQHPVHVGDVAKVRAEVVFSSLHTIAVSVQVTAERMAWSTAPAAASTSTDGGCCEEMVCNKALLWLVGVVLPNESRSAPTNTTFNPKLYARSLAPKFPIPDKAQDIKGWNSYQRAAKAYETRKRVSATVPGSSFDEAVPYTAHSENKLTSTAGNSSTDVLCFTPDYSAVELVQVMLPSDCTTNTGLVGGGVVMKLMDNACGVVAVRHCGTNVVTVSVDCVNLVAPVLLGDVLRVRARPTFTSSHSLEIEVSVVAERFSSENNEDTSDGCHTTGGQEEGRLTRQEIVTTERAYFTFVSLPLSPKEGSPLSLSMRPLVLKTPSDREQFDKGKKRYENRKAMRRARQEEESDEDD